MLHIRADGAAEVVYTGEPETVKMRGSGSRKVFSFPADGFSVYAVVDPGEDDDEARITINFYGKDTSEPIATMYVKNSDDLAAVTEILYDPGAGDINSEAGETFRGWLVGDVAHVANGDTPVIPEYTVANATNGTLKTIEDIREWAATFEKDTENEIIEGDVVNIRAAIYKIYVITYLDSNNIAQSADSVLIMPDDTSAFYPYTISQDYNPVKDTVKFEGWEPSADTKGNITTDTQQDDNLYQLGDVINITGNINFKVVEAEGHWVVFHENGKGATYKAPQFVYTNDTAKSPGDMTRKGYTFGGWYKEVTGVADDHGYTEVTGDPFVFPQNIDNIGDTKLELYAKWIPNDTAPYTIVFWGEKIGADGKVAHGSYEVLDSFVNNIGIVGENIPYIYRNNGVEDYSYQTGNINNWPNANAQAARFGSRTDTLPNGQDAEEKGEIGHYRGFNLREDCQNLQVEITPEGDAVLNLYYDRVRYNFRFYLYRNGTENNRYDYANGSANGSGLNGLVSWHSNQTEHPSIIENYTINGETVIIKSESVNIGNGNRRTYYYFEMPAYYGETISDIWPTYDKIVGANGRVPVSYVMMVPTHLKQSATGSGTDTVKGVISVLDWNILGATNSADGNFVIIRFPGSNYEWRYHIWYEAVDADHIPAGKTRHDYEGKIYYEETVMEVRSSNTEVKSQNEPKYDGFDYQMRVGQNNRGVWEASNTINNTDGNGHKYGTYWTTTENGTTLYHLNYIYNRQQFRITYFDGNYVDGDGKTIQNRASQQLHQSGLIPQGAVIPDEYVNYVPDGDDLEDGYEFVGWYLDQGCTVPYTWGTMPVGPINGGSAISVYAKWQQIQYRVFLHSGVPNGEPFTWGSNDQKMNFRIAYGGKVSLPTGRGRDGWEFLGWYTTPDYVPSTRFTSDFELTDDNVTGEYNKATDYTDVMNKWGYIEDDEPKSNSDVDRPWITKKLDLYAKWYQVLNGAEGINVVYDPILAGENVAPPTGHNAPTDSSYYIDTAEATAQPGSIADDQSYYEFECWVVQKWDGTEFVDTEVKVYPGDTFKVLKANAREEDITEIDPNHPNITKKYTVQLRAQYNEKEDPKPTHIWWFPNYPDMNKEDNTPDIHNKVYVSATVSEDADKMAINQSVYIKTPGTIGNSATSITVPAGYMFVGWARVNEGDSKSLTNTDNYGNLDVQKNMFLYYHPADSSHTSGYYTTDAAGKNKVIGYVAADENNPIHDLYAMWGKLEATKTVDGLTTEDRDYLASDYSTLVAPKQFKFVIKNSNGKYYLRGNGFTANTPEDATKYTVPAGSSLGAAGTALAITDNLGFGTYDYIEILDSAALEGYTLVADGTTYVDDDDDEKTCETSVTGVVVSLFGITVVTTNVDFNNVYTRDKGTLKIVKLTAPTTVNTGDKKFKVTIKNNRTGKYLQSTTSITNDSFGDTAVEFELGVGESNALIIEGLPTDEYTVEEVVSKVIDGEPVSYVDIDGYRFDGESYKIKVGSGNETTGNTGRVNNDTTTTVTITNEYTQVKDVIVTKTVAGDKDKVPDGFSITTNNSAYGPFTASDDIYDETTKTYTWTIPNVQVGTQITFTETGYAINYYDVAYTVSVNGTQTVTSETTGATPSGTLTVSGESNASNTVAFVNTYTANTVDLILTKEVDGTAANPAANYVFNISAVDQNNQPITITGLVNPVLLNPKNSSVNSYTLEDVPIGAVVTVVESGVVGFTTTVSTTTGVQLSSVTVGKTNNEDNGERSFTITVTPPADSTSPHRVTVTNTKNVDPPPTGIGLESMAYIMLLCLAMFGMATGLAARKKRSRG